MQFYTLKVIAINKETADAVTVHFKQPGLKKIKYSAGQYLTLIFRINGRKYIRPYSFSSAPSVDTDLTVTIKRVPGGVVSNHIIDRLKENDIVEVMEPLGDFTLNYNNITPHTRIILWGAGSGITPLMSIAKYALSQNLVKHITLVYGNRNAESVIFNEKIIALKKHFPDKFFDWHFHTHLSVSSNNPYLIQGRINPDKVLEVMQFENNLNDTVHYICGPIGLKESVKAVLNKLKVGDDQIFSEDFEAVRNPSDFENIITRQVVIEKDGITENIEVVKGKSILEICLDKMIELNYSCQTGSCLVCRARVLKGQVKTIGVKTLPEGLNNDECLLCCSFPLTDDVVIEVT